MKSVKVGPGNRKINPLIADGKTLVQFKKDYTGQMEASAAYELCKKQLPEEIKESLGSKKKLTDNERKDVPFE
jgi:hypothetical protein